MNTIAAQKGISNISIEVPLIVTMGRSQHRQRQFQQRNPADLTIDGKNPIQQVLLFLDVFHCCFVGFGYRTILRFYRGASDLTCLSDWLISAGPFLSANDANVDQHVKTFYRML